MIASSAHKSSSTLTDSQLKQIRDRFGKFESVKPSRCRRSHAKVAYFRDDIPVRFSHPGSPDMDVLMPSQNLSEGGICLLHSRFVHLGTECRVTLKRVMGGTDVLNGSVVWCRLISGMGHAAGRQVRRADLHQELPGANRAQEPGHPQHRA